MSTSLECAVRGCKEPKANLSDDFCATHDDAWMDSREYDRAFLFPERWKSMLADFATRVWLENGGHQ